MKSYFSFYRMIFITTSIVVFCLGQCLADLTEDKTKEIERLKEEAAQAMKEDRWDDFETLVRKMIEIDKDDPQNHRRLGQALFNNKKYREAEPLLEKALDLGDTAALSGLALTKLWLGKDDWVQERVGILLRQLEGGDIDCLSPLAVWSIKKKDFKVFQEAMENIDDRELSRNPRLSHACLGAYRLYLKEIEGEELDGE